MAGSEYRAGPSGRFSHGAPARGFKRLTLEREEIAEMDYRPSKAEGTYRLLVLRKTLRPYSFRAHRAVSFWDGAVALLSRPLPIP